MINASHRGFLNSRARISAAVRQEDYNIPNPKSQ